jgi:hypothetical protein
MTAATTAAADGAGADKTRTFLAVVADELRDTAARLQVTVDQVIEIAALRTGETDREFVMTLQDFDRLQQEFIAIAKVLEQLASGAAADAPQTHDHPIRDVIAGVSLADLKERLLRQFSMADLLAVPASDEVVF